MTPKEKANELMQKVYDLDQHNKTTKSRCKQIALLCVDEILEIIRYHGTDIGKHSLKHWLDVKQEISLL